MTDFPADDKIALYSCPEKNCPWISPKFHVDQPEYAYERYSRHYQGTHMPDPKMYPTSITGV